MGEGAAGGSGGAAWCHGGSPEAKAKRTFDLPESCLIWMGKTLVSSPFCTQVAPQNVTASHGRVLCLQPDMGLVCRGGHGPGVPRAALWPLICLGF